MAEEDIEAMWTESAVAVGGAVENIGMQAVTESAGKHVAAVGMAVKDVEGVRAVTRSAGVCVAAVGKAVESEHRRKCVTGMHVAAGAVEDIEGVGSREVRGFKSKI